MKKLIYFVCLAFAGIFLLGCEKNDMPEPESRRTILKMELSWICRVLRLKVGCIAIG